MRLGPMFPGLEPRMPALRRYRDDGIWPVYPTGGFTTAPFGSTVTTRSHAGMSGT